MSDEAVLSLRPATEDDARLLWEWRNDPHVRANSLSTEAVPWKAHTAWLARRLSSPTTRLWILEEGKRPVGQIRYDLEGESAAISYSIGAPFRGRGLGAEIVRRSMERACHELGVRSLTAVVKEDNVPSRRVFERLGFHGADSHTPAADGALRYVWDAPSATHQESASPDRPAGTEARP